MARQQSLRRAVVAALALVALDSAIVRAHPLAPALLDVREIGGGRAAVTWKASLLAVPGARVEPVLPAHCRSESAPIVAADIESVTKTWTIACDPSGLVGERVGFRGLADAKIDGLVRVTLADGRMFRGVVRAAEPLLAVPERQRPLDLARGYLRAGVVSVLTGPDHLLFVAGLLLLVRGRRRLAEALAAFVVGHSLTLTLAGLDVVHVPSRPIELGIALSVFALAAELAREPSQETPSIMRRWPWVLALAFGLLHGFGFAAVLRDVGLPPAGVPLALFAFNLGVEIAFLAFVAVLLAAASSLRSLQLTWPVWVRRAPLYTIGSLGAFWCFERAAALIR